MGWQDEQHQGQSEGDSLSGSNLRIEYHRDPKSHFYVTDKVVNEIFATTPHLNVSLSDIKKYLETKPPIEEQEKYFSEVFNDGETQLTLSDDTVVGYKAYSNGVLVWKGEYDNPDGTNFIEWKHVAGHFNAMRMLGMLESYTKNLPNVNQQLNIISEEAGKTPAFSFSQELIDTYLTKGIASSKFRTYEQFVKSSSKKENIAFLKHRYGISGSTTAVSYTGLWDNTDGKGIELFFYKNGMHYKRQLLPWEKVEKRIGELIKLDRYLNPKEKAEYPKWLEQEEARRAEIAEIRRNREILSTAPSEVEVQQVPDEHYEYHLGDTVFIGANEYQILTLGDDVVKLYDVQYPLFNQEMSRAEFEQKVQENPSNDHLKVR
ncbi:MAG: helicase, partial [Acutalibacteraceae bacterium]|nr:helicase [Acutalibacteraceae bacterium]